jgi:hypothetical protein
MTSGSRIDASTPKDGALASKAALRANFQAAKDEIEALQRAAVRCRQVTGDHMVAADDLAGVLIVDSEQDVTILCPTGLNRDPGVIRWVKIVRAGRGRVCFVAAPEAQLRAPGGRCEIPEVHGTALISFLAPDIVLLEGV